MLPQQKFIVVADDYGVSSIIDNAIEKLIANGIVTAVAVFANGPDSIKKAKQLKEQYNVSIGIHFTITSGDRVSEESYSLSKRNSKKNKSFRGIGTQHPDKAKDNHLELELFAQIKKFEDEDLIIEFFSDHHGILSNTFKGLITMLNVIKKYNQKHKEKVGFKAAKIRNPIFVSQIVDKPNCLSHSNMYKIARSGKIFRNIFRKKYLSKISTTLDTLKAFLKIIYSESIDTPDYFIDKFYDNANEDSLKCISVHVPQTKNEFRNSEGLTDITYELIVHLATIPANHETNKEYQKELTKLIRFRGVCDNYPLEQRDLEFKVLESHLLTYIGKSNLISYDFT